MAYVKQPWADNVTPVDAGRMNHIEDGIFNADAGATAALAAIGMRLLWDSVDAAVALPAAQIVTPALPQTYKHLLIVASARHDVASAFDAIYFRLNGDAGANYDRFWQGVASGAQTSGICGFSVGSAGTAGETGQSLALLANYANAATRKQLFCFTGVFAQDGVSGAIAVGANGSKWKNTAPVTTITVFPQSAGNFLAPSRFSVYGLG